MWRPGSSEAKRSDRCPDGLTRPYTVDALVRAANHERVSLIADPDCGGLSAAAIVAGASNIPSGTNDRDGASDREGHVICHLLDRPLARGPFEVGRSKHPDDQETRVFVGNVSCAIYPSGSGQIDRLAAALVRLSNASVERRTCPSSLGRPVSVRRLIAPARKNGLPLLRDARCIEPGVVDQASTILPYAPDVESDTVRDAFGDVTCLLGTDRFTTQQRSGRPISRSVSGSSA